MKYFSVEELCRSEKAKKLGIKNIPNEAQRANLVALIEKVLDPLREMYGKPIMVSSGFRNYNTNQAVGGSKTSDHMSGCAADIYAKGGVTENKKLAKMIAEKLCFSQLIDEKGYAWVHVSFHPNGDNHHQILRTKDGKNYTNITISQL